MVQKSEILFHLRMSGSITPLEALKKFGCFRLSARIYDLRKAGHKIKMVMVEHNKKHFAKYILQGRKQK